MWSMVAKQEEATLRNQQCQPNYHDLMGKRNTNEYGLTYVTDANGEILNIPLLPSIVNNQFVHYYVEERDLKEHSANNEVQAKEDNVDESLL